MSTTSTKIVYQSKFFRIEQKVVERNGKTFTKDFIERNAAVFILPIATDGQVHLVSQYRDALDTTALEVIAGMMEGDSDPLEAAKRELQEETGLTAKNWKQIASWELSVNMNSKVYAFVATELQEGETNFDEDEVIEQVKMPLGTALSKIESGEIIAAPHAAILLLYDKLKKEGKL